MIQIKSIFSIERVVTLLTPFFAAVAATFTAWLGRHTGVHLDASAIEGIEAAAFLGTCGIVAKWLHGRQIPAIAGITIPKAEIDQVHSEIEAYLKAHAPQLATDEERIVAAVLGRLQGALGQPPPPAAPPPGPVAA